MSERQIEELARLMHAEAKRYAEARGHSSLEWEDMSEIRQSQYRHVAREVLRKLGH